MIASYSPVMGASLGDSWSGVRMDYFYDVPYADSSTDARLIDGLIAMDRYPLNPDEIRVVGNIDTVWNSGREWDHFGVRALGRVVIPEAGFYSWAIAANNNAVLNVDGVAKCWVRGAEKFTGSRSFGVYQDQLSGQEEYKRGQVVNLEVIFKESDSSANLTVGWERPGHSGVDVISPDFFVSSTYGQFLL